MYRWFELIIRLDFIRTQLLFSTSNYKTWQDEQNWKVWKGREGGESKGEGGAEGGECRGIVNENEFGECGSILQ